MEKRFADFVRATCEEVTKGPNNGKALSVPPLRDNFSVMWLSDTTPPFGLSGWTESPVAFLDLTDRQQADLGSGSLPSRAGLLQQLVGRLGHGKGLFESRFQTVLRFRCPRPQTGENCAIPSSGDHRPRPAHQHPETRQDPVAQVPDGELRQTKHTAQSPSGCLHIPR